MFITLRELSRVADQHDELSLTPLHRAAYQGDVEEVKNLLKRGCDANARDIYGWTALHDAAMQGHGEIVMLLLEAGADVDVQDNEEKYTPLHDAARKNRVSLVRILLEAKANTQLKDKEGLTLLPVLKSMRQRKLRFCLEINFQWLSPEISQPAFPDRDRSPESGIGSQVARPSSRR